MIDQTGVSVSDFAESKAFYSKALAAIGYALLLEFPASVTGHADVAGFDEPPKPDFRISLGRRISRPCTSRFVFPVVRRAMLFTRRRWLRVAVTMVRRASGRIITSIITVRLYWIRMGTLSKWCAIGRSEFAR